MLIKKEEWKNTIESFQKAVNQKLFKRIGYSEWKKINGHKQDTTIFYYAEERCVVVRSCIEDTVHFPLGHHSFGDFLYEKYLKGGSGDKMSTTWTDSTGDYYTYKDLSFIRDNGLYCDSAASATLTYYPDSWSTGSSLSSTFDNYLTKDEADKYFVKKENKKEEDKKMKGFNFDFGPCKGDNIRMSAYGLAIKNTAGVWVSYNTKDKSIIDVDIFNFDGAKFLFKMPVAIKDVKVGDIIVHNKVPMFVIDVKDGIKVIDVREGEEKKIVPTKNMFGFDFITKVVSMFDAFGKAPTTDTPFGNMLPFIMMDDDKEIDPMVVMMMMNGGTSFDMNNPMMMYFMMKDGKMNDMLPLMMMMNNNKPNDVK